MATASPRTDHSRWLRPLHGIVAAYPLAFFSGALVTDIIYVNTAQMQWANFSVWMIAFGLAMGVVAAVVGIVDALLVPLRDRPRRSWPHSLTTILMLAFALVNAFVHSRDGWTSVMPAGLTLSIVTTALALASSWLGFSLEARTIYGAPRPVETR